MTVIHKMNPNIDIAGNEDSNRRIYPMISFHFLIKPEQLLKQATLRIILYAAPKIRNNRFINKDSQNKGGFLQWITEDLEIRL